MNYNKATLVGRVTRDPELRQMPSGTAVTKFGLATNTIYKTKDGEKKETAQFHNCVVFGKIAETIAKYVTKRQELLVEGRIEYRTWVDKENNKRNATDIIVDTFQFGAKAKGDESSPQNIENIGPDKEEIDIKDIEF